MFTAPRVHDIKPYPIRYNEVVIIRPKTEEEVKEEARVEEKRKKGKKLLQIDRNHEGGRLIEVGLHGSHTVKAEMAPR